MDLTAGSGPGSIGLMEGYIDCREELRAYERMQADAKWFSFKNKPDQAARQAEQYRLIELLDLEHGCERWQETYHYSRLKQDAEAMAEAVARMELFKEAIRLRYVSIHLNGQKGTLAEVVSATEKEMAEVMAKLKTIARYRMPTARREGTKAYAEWKQRAEAFEALEKWQKSRKS